MNMAVWPAPRQVDAEVKLRFCVYGFDTVIVRLAVTLPYSSRVS